MLFKVEDTWDTHYVGADSLQRALLKVEEFNAKQIADADFEIDEESRPVVIFIELVSDEML